MTTPFEPGPDAASLRDSWRALSSAGADAAHLSDDEWVRLAADELDAATRDRLADHIERCAHCAAVFRAVHDVRAGAVAIDAGAPRPAVVVDDEPSPRGDTGEPDRGGVLAPWRAGLAAAAVLTLFVGGAAWWRASRPAPESAVSSAPAVAPGAATAPTTPASSDEGRFATAPGNPADARPSGNAPSTPARPDAPRTDGRPADLLADAPSGTRPWAAVLQTAPAVMLPPSLTLVMRGEANVDRDAFMAAFGPAIQPYRAGRYDAAATALAEVTRRFPAVTETWFYLGVSHLYAARPADAVEPLRRAQTSGVVADDARWLTAVALERAGKREEATSALRAACASPTPAAREACAAVRAPEE